MRIAQVAPLYESVPPALYGGTERVVSWLTEELVRLGHEVTLFASGDSRTRAELIAPCPRALRLDGDCGDPLARHIVMMEHVFRDPARFDIFHFHIDYLHFPLSRRLSAPQLTTLHGRLDLPDLVPLYREFREMPVVSISHAQREPLPWLNWQATVHHGMPERLHTFNPNPDDYLLFVGRISPEKQVDCAIEIARHAGRPLKIAAKVDKADREYYECCIKPLLNDPAIEYLGEVGGRDKDELLGNAYALLFPINWPEPFGLVTIEAMACGTPVIAYCRGSVPEIVDDGVTGFIVNGIEDAAMAVERVARLDRAKCRETFERRFTSRRMAEDYLTVYERLAARGRVRAHA